MKSGAERLLLALRSRLHESSSKEPHGGAAVPISLIEEVVNEDFDGSKGQEGILSSEDALTTLENFKYSVILTTIDSKRKHLPDDEIFFNFANAMSGIKTATYEELSKYSSSGSEYFARFFSAEKFLLFPRDDKGAINVEDFLRFIQRSIDVETTCLQLVAHAKDSTFITEQELERFLYDRIPELTTQKKLHESFYPYYVFTASRRFFFFLDAHRARRINIKKVAHSSVMGELLFLRRISQYEGEVDPASLDQINANWFSGHNALRIYSQYLELDKDQNGMLSQEELLQFSGLPGESLQLTRTAVQRLFEEYITYRPMEMDYRTFLDLVLALENKMTIESMSYFFRILDMDKCGRLSPAAIMYFYKDVCETLKKTNYEAPTPTNMVVEVFDILACNDSRGPTFQELANSGQGHTVISMLLDVNGFWMYDNRESLMQQNATSSSSSSSSSNQQSSSGAAGAAGGGGVTSGPSGTMAGSGGDAEENKVSLSSSSNSGDDSDDYYTNYDHDFDE